MLKRLAAEKSSPLKGLVLNAFSAFGILDSRVVLTCGVGLVEC